MVNTLPIVAYLMWRDEQERREKLNDPVARELYEILEQKREEEAASAQPVKAPARKTSGGSIAVALRRLFGSKGYTTPAFGR